ncbi:CRAL-TRIO domain [Pseudocohnilembus persalinus]|uniref:CRAL-TRIO domain n=1 Tax=Pseudocohnilembus persalinus TaxID=266149 RepID=A0A0V0QA42_PSEPJ|nr:CRAL-TRIO domain [Pseudocohnilembus persalinus]|eukprot:KRW98932.1 CRAL-TRIO domain [Pseudocohnilembus persalinus]
MQSENKLLDPNSVFQFSKNSNKKFDDITIQTPGIQKTQDQLLLSTKRNVYMLELDDFDDKQKTNREKDETFKRYIVTYYWAVATLMLVGSSGNNSIETAFTIITLLWTVGIFAYIISKISMIIQELNQDSSMFKKELSIMNKFMLSKDIPQDLQTKVRSCLEYMFKSSEKCVICQSDYHLEQNCNLLNYRPNKYMLSLKNNRQNDKKERQKLKECRKIDRKHISPLLDIQQLQKLSDNLKNKYYKDKEIKLYFKFIAQLNQSDSNSSLTSIVSYSDDDSDSYLSRSQFQTESSYQSQLSNQNRYQKAENQIQRKNYSQKTQISQLKQIQSIKQNNKLSSKKSQKGQSLECNLQNKDQNISDKIEGKSRKNSLTGSKSKNVSIFCTNYDKDQISQTGNNEYKQNQALNQLPNKFLSNQKFRSNQNTNNNSFDEQYAIHDTSLNQVHQDIYNTDWANKKRGKPQFYQQYSNQISQQSIGNKSYQQQILSQNQTINIDEYSSGYECSNQQPSEGEYNKIYTNENKIKQDQKQYLYDDQIMGQQGNILDQKGILKNKNYNQKQNFRHLKDQLSKIIEPNVGYYQNQNAKNKQKNKITNFKSSCELDEEDLEDIQVVSSRHPNTRVQSQDYQQNQVHDQVISHLNSNMAHIDQSYQQQEFNQPENNLFAEFFKVKKKQDLNGKLMRERFGSLQKKKTHTRKQGTIEDSQFSISSEHKAFDNSIVNRNYFLEGNNQVYKSKNDIEYQSAKEQEEYRKKQQKKEKNIIREFVKSKSQLAKELQHDNQKLKVLCQGLLEQIVEHNKINPSTKLQQFSDQNIQSQIYKILFKKQDSQYSQNYSLNNQKQVQRNIVRGNHYPSSENKQKMFQNIGNKTSTIENDMNSNYNYNKNYNTLKTLESKNSLLKEKDGNNQLSRFLSKQRRKSIEEEFSMNNFFKMIGLGDNNQNNEDINQLYESKRSFQRNGSYISENKNVYMPNLNVNSFSEQQQTQQIPARSQKNRHVSLLDLQQKNNFNLEDQIKELVVQMDQKQLNEQMFFEFDVQKNWEVYYPQFNLNFQIKTYNQKFLKKEEERNNVKDKMKRRQSKYVNKINTNVNSANTSKSNLDNLGFSQRVKIQQQQDNENSEEHQYQVKGKKKMSRQLFEGRIQYTDLEKEEIQKLKQLLKEKEQLDVIEGWQESEILRFILGNQFDLKKCIKSMVEHNEWKKKWIPQKYNKQIEEFLGIYYIQGRDSCFRPILVLQLKRLNLKEYDEDFLYGAITFLIEVVIRNMMIPGIVEDQVFIMNFKDMGLTDIPMSFIKKLINYLQNNYRSRLYRFYAVNVPKSITFTWYVVKQVLEDTTVKKINFINENVPKPLFQHTHPIQLEKQFGGEGEDKSAATDFCFTLSIVVSICACHVHDPGSIPGE